MDDEYGKMDDDGDTFVTPRFELENGKVLRDAQVRYRTFGALNPAKDNAMVVCHALTGNASLDSWWGEMLGKGLLFDTSKYFVICANVLGSCYGTTGPTSINPDTQRPYSTSFPDVTVRDSVGLHILMVKSLGIRQVFAVVGGSLGGMQALEWGLMGGPSFVRSLVVMCCGANHHAWQIAISETQRQALYADPNWAGGAYTKDRPPNSGLSLARQIAMFTYRSHTAYTDKFGRKTLNEEPGQGQAVLYDVEKYLRYQGVKFLARFDPLSYVKVTRLMDSHDVGRGRGGKESALSGLTQPVQLVSVSSDVLYPPAEQQELHKLLPNSRLYTVVSDSGHDGFLLDQHEVMPVAIKFLEEVAASPATVAARSKL